MEVRKLTLIAVTKIPLTKAPRPSEDALQLQDGTAILEEPNLQELAEQLRRRYADERYERTLQKNATDLQRSGAQKRLAN